MKFFRGTVVVFTLLLSSLVLAACSLLDKNSQGGIQVMTNDINSSVFLDETYLDRTPLIERNLKPGIYTLKIQPDDTNYAPYETDVNIRPGALTVVTWKPAPKPELSGGVIYELEPLDSGATEVAFSTIPDGAIISLSGQQKEFSPFIFTNVKPGHTEFEVTAPSYEVQKHTIDVISGNRLHIKVKLAKLRSAEQELSGEDLPTPDASHESSQSATEVPITSTSSRSAQSSSKVKILPTGFFEEGQEVLRVRSAPVNGVELGFVSVGAELVYLNETNQGWLKVEFNGQEAWIAQNYAQVVE